MLEEAGFDGAFTLDTNVDPFLSLLLAAEHTERLELITGVAIAFARSPMTLAQQAWNLQRFSGGRLILGLGSQVQVHIEKRFSMPWSEPAARMREYVLALQAIWDSWEHGTPLKFRGQHYTHTLMNPVFSPDPLGLPRPQVHLGALGPGMVRVVGEVADGLYGHPFTTVRFWDEIQMPALQEGLGRAGRSRSDLCVSAMLMTATGRDETELALADRALRKLLAFYGSTPSYWRVLELHGWGDLGPQLNVMSKQGRWDEMADHITDEMLEAFAVVGPPEDIPGLVVDRCRGFADRVTLYAPYRSDPSVWPPIVRGIRAVQDRPGRELTVERQPSR